MQLKKIFYSLTLTSISWLVLGILSMLAGVYIVYLYKTGLIYIALGFVTLGGGSVICGLTNGFTDQSPRGRFVSKFGILGMIVGTLLLIYYGYRFI